MRQPIQPTQEHDTRLDIRFGPMDVVDVPALVAARTHRWFNQTPGRVTESVVRLGALQGESHRHRHDNEEEYFHVVEGRFPIALGDRTIDLGPGQRFLVPKGMMHRPRAPVNTVVLMVETDGIVPTGD